MTHSLSRRSDIELSVFATQSDNKSLDSLLDARLSTIKRNAIPGGDRFARMWFMGLRLQGIDRWSDGLDWVYCPKEQPVATRTAKLAVNVHDMLAFEPPIVGLQPKRSLRSRLRWSHVMRQVRSADLVTTVSEFTRERLISYLNIDPDRVVVTGNGVTDLYFRQPQSSDEMVLKKYGVTPQGYFISVGSLTARKGGDVLLDTESRLRNAGFSLPILLSGRRHDPDLLAQYQSVKESNSRCLLHLLGFVPDEEQAILMSHSLALLFPSRYEGFGIPALEAMAAGTIAVCARTSALPEVVGQAGLLVEPNSPGDLCRVVTSLANGDVERQRLISLGRDRADQFRWESCVSRLTSAMQLRSR